MIHKIAIASLLAFELTAAADTASADPPAPSPEPETIVIIDRAPDPDAAPAARDRDRALGDAPFVTIVHPDEHPATASVADAVGATVGAQTRSLGGLGAYESVSIRGAAPGQTQVLIDGVPLARIAAVTTDLGRFALDSFGEVELYRGAVPVELGGAGVGGALNLVTQLGRGEHGERFRASVGMGSFGARHLRVHYGDAHLDGRLLSSTTIGYQGATGDYTYYSDNGTQLNLGDDTYQTRRNNGFDQLDVASRIGAADHGAVGGVRVAWKQQGLPGSIAQPSVAASMSTLDVVVDGRGEHEVAAAIERELGYVLLEEQRMQDSDGKLGLGTQQRAYRTLSGGASSTWSAGIADHQLVGGVEARGDHFRDRDLMGTQPSAIGDRLGGAVLAEDRIAVTSEVEVTPAMRLDVVHTSPAPITVGNDAGMPVPARWDVVPSPRLTARVAVTEDISVKGSAGWYVRLPTLVELFGDRGFILGAPGLRPERGPSADAGAVWAPSHALGPVDRILVEADVFATRPRDTIAIITTAGYVSRAANIGDSQTYGGELVASGRLARSVSITASYTRLATDQISSDVNLDGKALPRAPGHVLYARADLVRDVGGRRATLWADSSYQATSYLDNANHGQVPARLLLGSGARVELVRGVGIAFTVENLTDTRVVRLPLDPPPSPTFTSTPTALTDVAGFPLPGRAFYLALDWSH